MTPSEAMPWSIDSPDPETTFALAALLGRSIGARGLAIGLVGPLGAGKTVFVKGLAEGLGVDPRIVSSPTFVIAQEYPVPEGPERLHHLDFYRLASEAELEAIGFLDLLGPGQVLAVEWLDRFPRALGPDRLEVVFLPARLAEEGTPEAASGDPALDGAGRRIRVTPHGDEAGRVLQDWRSRWARVDPERAPSERAGSPLAGHDVKLIVALLAAAWIGFEGVAATTDGALAIGGTRTPVRQGRGCAALAPERVGVALDDARNDELGPLRVQCVESESEVEAAVARDGTVELDGMARLLAGGRVDPNRASRRLLESLPGIGPARAAAIEAERARTPFRTVEDLERVSGIGPKTRAAFERFLEVDSGTPPG